MMYNLCVRHCRIYGILNAIFFLSLEIYFLADHIIHGILDSLKTELQFTVYNTAVCICVMFFKFHFPSLDLQKGLFFIKKKLKLEFYF